MFPRRRGQHVSCKYFLDPHNQGQNRAARQASDLHGAHGRLLPLLSEHGGLAALLVDLTPLGHVEHVYGSRAYAEVLDIATTLILELSGTEVRVRICSHRAIEAATVPRARRSTVVRRARGALSTRRELLEREPGTFGIALPSRPDLAGDRRRVRPRSAKPRALGAAVPRQVPAEGASHPRGTRHRVPADHRHGGEQDDGLRSSQSRSGGPIFRALSICSRPPRRGTSRSSSIVSAAGKLSKTPRGSQRRRSCSSPSSLYDPALQGEGILRFLEEAGLEPKQLVFELTETYVIENYSLFGEAVRQFTELGINIGIDDIGAGYSGLERIAWLEPKYLKFDIGLIRHVDTSHVRQEMVRALKGMADKMGSTVVAEGIERQEELETLLELGITYGQGFLLGRPEPPAWKDGIGSLSLPTPVPATTVEGKNANDRA